jgi:hypothetical protein
MLTSFKMVCGARPAFIMDSCCCGNDRDSLSVRVIYMSEDSFVGFLKFQ